MQPEATEGSTEGQVMTSFTFFFGLFAFSRATLGHFPQHIKVPRLGV